MKKNKGHVQINLNYCTLNLGIEIGWLLNNYNKRWTSIFLKNAHLNHWIKAAMMRITLTVSQVFTQKKTIDSNLDI